VKPINKMSRLEFAAFVHSLLLESNIDVILSGGSCVSIYSEEQYVSGDLDFIRTGLEPFWRLRAVMVENGFIEENRYFKHPDSVFYVEFPGGPPSVGEDPIVDYNLVETECGSLKLLTPTDCVKDRLSAYYHWRDQEALHQALMVAEMHSINMTAIAEWSLREGKTAMLSVFLKQYRPADCSDRL
jgi:hypothetical protein